MHFCYLFDFYVKFICPAGSISLEADPALDPKKFADPWYIYVNFEWLSVFYRAIYENAKRKDSSRMKAQIIVSKNAKDKTL